MKFKAFITILVLISLSACAHRSSPELADQKPQSNSPTDEAASDTIIDDTKTAIEDVKPDQNTTIIKPATVVSSTSIEHKIDLLERMRRRFEFPDFNSKVVRKQEKWNSEHKTFLNNLFTRATPFLFHIVEEIEKRDLPMELALLPAIESSYKPRAVSSSSAVGLWQFVPSTGKAYGLNQDWWYDGRRDALASTKAALDYLTILNKRFKGDWFITLAAYNAGQGTVSRAIKANAKKGKSTRYQDLKLRTETQRYIPKIIALKNIINNPHKYGVTLPEIANKPYFKVVKLKGQIDLHKFADTAGIERDELSNLNAGFKRWATSPNGPHQLLIPINANGNVNHAEIAVQQTETLNYANHRIARGESLSTIARKYGVSVNALRSSNNLSSNNIRAGKNLLIPVRASAQPTASITSHANSTAPKQHTVKKGDTLWSISRFYKIQLNNLLTWNNLSKNHVLKLNQTIRLIQN